MHFFFSRQYLPFLFQTVFSKYLSGPKRVGREEADNLILALRLRITYYLLHTPIFKKGTFPLKTYHFNPKHQLFQSQDVFSYKNIQQTFYDMLLFWQKAQQKPFFSRLKLSVIIFFIFSRYYPPWKFEEAHTPPIK